MLRTNFLALIFCVALAAPSLFATTRISLNGDWAFHTDPKAEGEKAGWTRQAPSAAEAVRVPHTWNIGAHDDYEGVAWYFRTFRLPELKTTGHVELHFGATFYKAHVWLNGVELGAHEGGFAAYYFDITPHLRDTNYLAVRLDNRPNMQTIPGIAARLGERAWYDWWHYGGIIRDVWLTASDTALVRRQKIRTSVAAKSAAITNTIYVENVAKQPVSAEIVAEALLEGDSQSVAQKRQKVTLKPGSNQVPIALTVTNPRLWGIDHPNLYRMNVSVLDSRGRLLDENSDTFGIRTIEIRDRHLLVNGERVRLSGITRHEESPWEGHAETRGTILQDYNDLKNLQVTLTRPVHYPQHPFVLDYADRNGILLVPEIPLWQFSEKQLSDPKVIALAQQQMREMVEQAGNHPSIFAWSVCNESETSKPGGVAYFQTMKKFLKDLDPGRFVTFANDSIPGTGKPEDDAAYFADFIMMNQYYGTWKGPAEGLAPGLDKVGRDYPDKMLIISEFGVASFFEPNDAEGDRLRVRIMREQMAEFEKRDWIAGAIFWCYQDYKSHRNLWPGLTAGQVPMGLVDENRQRRPSYDVWREMNAPATIEATFDEWYKVPTSFTATVVRRRLTQLPSYPLHDYRASWEVRDDRQKLIAHGESDFPALDEPQTMTAKWQPTGSETALTLTVRLIRPTGFVAAERSFIWRDKSGGGETIRNTGE